MKVSANQADAFVRSPPHDLRVAVIYGPDEGLVRERALKLGETVVADLSDPFLVCDLTGAELAADPALLADEVAAISMMGGRRLIRVREATDTVSRIVASVLEDGLGDALTVLQAGQLGPRSSLRILAEKSTGAAAIPCYVDDISALEQVIQETLRDHGVRITADASAWLVGRLGSDRLVSRGEAEKLALYAGPGGEVGIEDAMACIGDSAADSLDDLIYAAADGDSNLVDLSIMRCFQAGASAVGILRAMTGHLLKLESAGVRVRQGEDAGAVLKSLRPPVFYKLERRFRSQMGIWRGPALARALQLTLEAELNCKRTGIPEDPVCGRALLQIASLARQLRNAR